MTLQLTEREIAIAKGEDPNLLKPGDDKEVEQEVKEDLAGPEEEVKAKAEVEDDEDEDEEEEPVVEANTKKGLEKGSEKASEKGSDKESEEEEIDLDPKKFEEDGYDEQTVKLVKYAKKLKEQLEKTSEGSTKLQSELESLKNQLGEVVEYEKQREHQRRLDEFHEILDSFEEDLFGRSIDEHGDVKKLDKTADENREKVYKEWVELHNKEVKKALKLAKKNGTEPELPSPRALIRKARETALAEELRALDRKKVQRQIEEQSKKRRPVSGSIARREFAPTSDAKKDIDPIKAIANDPRIVKFWQEAQDENGK